ncbi:hypothetical protein BDZ91DRAFT_712992 [Kalaharituber pfeilii]|nr:hypothetical protein BDZ91DRAFT_712992 [Kalaharituber pfeilii]
MRHIFLSLSISCTHSFFSFFFFSFLFFLVERSRVEYMGGRVSYLRVCVCLNCGFLCSWESWHLHFFSFFCFFGDVFCIVCRNLFILRFCGPVI